MTGDRREFLTQAAGLAVTLPIAHLQASRLQASSSETPISVALIGCGGMGKNHLERLVKRTDARVTAVCDVDQERLAVAKDMVSRSGQPTPVAVTDLRKILDDPRVQAVLIATPDHWHAPAAILACDAGKHVYVEKPCSHNVVEGRLMLEAARRNRRIMQVGTQSRSTPYLRRAMELLHNGAIGDVLVAKAWNSQRRGNIGKQTPSDPPATLDYDQWVGPAAWQPYQKNLLHAVWRFWHNFGAGDIGNDGIHEIDIARWGLGVNSHPDLVTGLGNKFYFDDDQQFPDTQYCVFQWSGDNAVGQRRQLVFEQRDWSPYVQEGHENGNAFYGTKGVMLLGKGRGYQLFGERNRLIEEQAGSPDLDAHHDNFLRCVRSGELPTADIEEGHRSATLVHLANIACRLNRTVHFDPAGEAVINDAEAHAMLKRAYRPDHWAVPSALA